MFLKLSDTRNHCFRCVNLYHYRLPRPKSLNKIIDLFKNVFWYVFREMCYEKILPSWCTFFIPDTFKTQELCKKEVEKYAWSLKYVPDNFKTQEMCNNAVKKNPFYLHYVPDWFFTQQ